MSGPPPPGYYPPPPPGQNPAPFPGQYPAASPAYYNPPQGQQQASPYGQYPAPGQLYPQGAVPPPYVPPTGGYFPPPAYYAGQASPAQAAYPPVAPAAFPGQGPHPAYGQWGSQPAAPPGVHPGPAHGHPGPPHGHPGPHHGHAGPHHGHPGPHHGHPGPHHGHPYVDVESDDSDPHEFALYSREDKHPLTVKFTNKTGKKVRLFWINKKGRRKRRGKLKPGQSKSIDTFETHIFMAMNKKVSREPLLINGSSLFYVFPDQHGNKHVNVDITKPSAHSAVDKLRSDAQVTIPVEVKFVNRSRREVQLDLVTTQGRREKKKVLPRGRCWRTTSWEGHYWVCCDPKQPDHTFVLNFGRYYRVQKSRRPRERVVITADVNISGSSSSSSSSD